MCSGWASRPCSEHFHTASSLMLATPSEVGAVIILTLQVRKLSCSRNVTGSGSHSLSVAGPSCQPAPKTLICPRHLPAITHIVPFADAHLDQTLQPSITWGSSAPSHRPHQFTLLCCAGKQPQPLSCDSAWVPALL